MPDRSSKKPVEEKPNGSILYNSAAHMGHILCHVQFEVNSFSFLSDKFQPSEWRAAFNTVIFSAM